jgi:hypothetical protein
MAKTSTISLRGKGKLGYINGRKKAKTDNNRRSRRMRDRRQYYHILVTPFYGTEHSEYFVHRAETYYNMLIDLKRIFDKQDNYAHIFKIKQEII